MTALTSSLDPAAAGALPGPGWLRARRQEAAERAGDLELPTSEEEVWRYSPIDDLELDTYGLVPVDGDVPPVPDGAMRPVRASLAVAGAVVVVDGRIAHLELADHWAERGVTLGAAADHPDGADILGSVTGAEGAATPELLGMLNNAFSTDPVVLDVPAGVTVDAPFVVVDWSATAGAVTFPHLVVRLGEDADATVVDHQGGDDVAALTVPVIELSVGPAARLHYLNVQQRGPQTWQIATQSSRVERDATLIAAQAALGGAYARTRADCRLIGRGATGNLMAVYYGGGDQTLDFRTFQDHAAPDTTSNLLFKGAVGGRSRSVYTGLIRVRPEGRGTNAFQTNRTIKLSEHAWAESVPNLEIENNDVHCSHASAVGPIDEEQRFYLESRGVPPEVAERLIVEGFFLDVLVQMPGTDAVNAVWKAIVDRLERRGADT
jgi:Fe-S cluster assembly protein SufD